MDARQKEVLARIKARINDAQGMLEREQLHMREMLELIAPARAIGFDFDTMEFVFEEAPDADPDE